jgi:hypothetical protein
LGLAAIVDEEYQMLFGIELRASGPTLVVGAKGLKGASKAEANLFERPADLPPSQSIKLRMTINGGSAELAYAKAKGEWETIL